MTFESHSVAETESFAGEIARALTGGTCIALDGEMGAGKTQFVRGLVIGLGGEGRSVSSPTFVLLSVYDSGRLKVFHLDAYRVGGPEDFEAIGFSELLEQNGVVVVEWPGKVAALLPAKRVDVHIEATGAKCRRISVSGLA